MHNVQLAVNNDNTYISHKAYREFTSIEEKPVKHDFHQ